MKIVQIASELTPIAKVGGLADFVQGLSATLTEQGEDVTILLPFYEKIKRDKLIDLRIVWDRLIVDDKGEPQLNKVWSAQVEGLKVLLIEPSPPNTYFKRKAIYGEKDDVSRFGYFSRAALEYLLALNKPLDVVHLHDWITGWCAPLYFELYRSLGLKVKRLVTTLHNLCYQGSCSLKELTQVGLSANLLTYDKLQHQTKPNQANILKGAIVYSDFLTTVSPSYCEEIKKNKGFGLSSLLIKYSDKLTGILNGIDTKYWDPVSDPNLLAPYPRGVDDIAAVLAAKEKNYKALAKKVGLKVKGKRHPLVASITRLAKQKGPELIQVGLEESIKRGGQAILLGSIVEKELELPFHTLQKRYQTSDDVHFSFTFDEELAHLIFAAADMLLIPSLFEPCGLTQMIALRYGTIPIVHRVGGLKDTIFDASDPSLPADKQNGFTFSHPSTSGLIEALDRAFDMFDHNQTSWARLIANGMKQDFSWKHSAEDYLSLYHQNPRK